MSPLILHYIYLLFLPFLRTDVQIQMNPHLSNICFLVFVTWIVFTIHNLCKLECLLSEIYMPCYMRKL